MTERIPYYADDAIELYHGEALSVLDGLPSASVDAIIADPPYSTGGAMRADRMTAAAVKYSSAKLELPDFSGDNRDQRGYLHWAALWLSEAYRITRPGGLVFVWTDWRQLPTATDAIQAGGWVWRGIVTWHKTQGRPMTGRFTLDTEFVVWGSSGQLPQHRRVHPSSVVRASAPREREHIAEKPEAVARHLLQVVPAGGVVLDPFTGTASTLLAAKAEGFRGIGIEIDERYCEIAARRLSQEMLAL